MEMNAKELREKLMMKPRKGAASFSPETLEEAKVFAEGYKKFLDNSRTEREAVAYTKKLAEENGFVPFEQDKKYNPGDRVYIINREKAIGLAVIGKNGTDNGVRLSIAHIDSPRIDLKPNPLYEDGGMALLKSHYYGGIKKYQWTTIPLSLHGRVVKLDGTCVDIRVGDDPGQHTVVFGMLGETLELTVRCSSRDGYAKGAYAAAKFLQGKESGRFSMFDVLGLN